MKPAYFTQTGTNSSDIEIDEATLKPKQPLSSGNRDCHGYLPGSLPAQAKITANHSHVYIDGDMKAGSVISLRQGVASARSLGEGAEVTGGYLLVISNEELSRRSKNVLKPNADYPAILVVSEEQRARVFDLLAAARFRMEWPPVTVLKKLAEEHPEIDFKVIPGNPGHDAALQKAGLTGRGL